MGNIVKARALPRNIFIGSSYRNNSISFAWAYKINEIVYSCQYKFTLSILDISQSQLLYVTELTWMSCGNGASYACNLSLGLNWWYWRLICKLFRISMLKAGLCNIFIHFILVNKWVFIYRYILEINCFSVAILKIWFFLVQKRNKLLNMHCI